MTDLTRRDALRLAAFGMSGAMLAGCGSSGGDGAPAAETSTALAAFDDSRPAGPPSGLPRRVAWANTVDIGIFAALGKGIATAAKDRGIGYATANANGDPQVNVDNINTLLARGVGAITIQPLNPAAQRPLMRRALEKGVCVIGIINNPCTLQIAARQYDIGFQQGRAAAQHIRSALDGRATVFNMNQDKTSPQLALRNQGVLAGLKAAGPGARVIDTYVTPAQQSTPANVFQLMTTALQRDPGINVVLGDDNFVIASYRAFEQTGKLKETMYFSGVDGDAEALALIKQGGPYRATSAFAWPLMGYGMGRFAADWIEGREVPRVMVAKTTLLDSAARVRAFETANADLESTFTDRQAYERYLPLLGNVSYERRGTIWNADYVPR